MKKMAKKIISFINQWRVVILIATVIIGLFYWFQVRPSRIYSNCDIKAKKDAIDALKTKAEMGASNYKEASTKGMYLKDDYDYDYKQCLRENGINR